SGSPCWRRGSSRTSWWQGNVGRQKPSRAKVDRQRGLRWSSAFRLCPHTLKRELQHEYFCRSTLEEPADRSCTSLSWRCCRKKTKACSCNAEVATASLPLSSSAY